MRSDGDPVGGVGGRARGVAVGCGRWGTAGETFLTTCVARFQLRQQTLQFARHVQLQLRRLLTTGTTTTTMMISRGNGDGNSRCNNEPPRVCVWRREVGERTARLRVVSEVARRHAGDRLGHGPGLAAGRGCAGAHRARTCWTARRAPLPGRPRTGGGGRPRVAARAAARQSLVEASRGVIRCG